MTTLSDCEYRIADLSARIRASTDPEEMLELGRQKHDLQRRLSAARNPEARREVDDVRPEQVYRYDQSAQEVRNPSPYRVLPPVEGRCPRPGCGRQLFRDREGFWCLADGYRWTVAARPVREETDADPFSETGRLLAW